MLTNADKEELRGLITGMLGPEGTGGSGVLQETLLNNVLLFQKRSEGHRLVLQATFDNITFVAQTVRKILIDSAISRGVPLDFEAIEREVGRARLARFKVLFSEGP